MGIFWIEFFIYTFVLNSYQYNISVRYILFVVSIHISTSLGWIITKGNITSNAQGESYERVVRLIKKNVSVFNGIISDKNKEPILNTAYDLSIGNEISSNKLIFVIKFGCPACLLVLNEAISICKVKPEIMHLTVRIQDKSYKRAKIIKSIISLYKNGDKIEINDPFWDCLLNNSEDKFENYLFDHKDIDNEVNFIYEEQQKWIDDLNSTITPIILYNNIKLPLWYEFKDVVKIISRNSHE